MKFRAVIFLIAAFIMTGCATVNRGTTDHFRIDTVPQGATATTSIETPKSKRDRRRNKSKSPVYESCSPTPCAIALPRLSEFVVRLEYENYEPVEMFVTNSSRKGSLTATTAATSTTALGAVGTATGVAASGVALYGGTGAAITGTTAGFNFGASLTPSTSSIAGAAIPPALILSGGMMLFDAGVGANRNFYPNPVVLELTPEGNPVKIDPLVALYREKLIAKRTMDSLCKDENIRDTYIKREERKACLEAKTNWRHKRDTINALIKPKKIDSVESLNTKNPAIKTNDGVK